jgi:phosphatidylglycerol:prolipoprotein diacylglycerol transferase
VFRAMEAGGMLAAIPFFELRVYNLDVPGLGVIPIDPWATLVCVGFVLGLELARSRAIKLGLDVRDVVDGAVFTVLMGFLFGHIVTVVAYYPERLQTDGIWSLLKVWEGFSSFGGFLGAVIGATLFYKVLRPREFWRFADIITYGFPFGWFFGRLGCGSVHDHVGKRTDFFLGMDFDRGIARFYGDADPAKWADGVRHELGLYEAAYMVPMMLAFWYFGKKDRPPGFFAGLFAVAYAPVRFGMDFLRNTDLSNQDARYLGLTPAQYGALLMLAGGAYLLWSRDWKGFKPWPMDGGEDQARRALGESPADSSAS